MDILLDTHIFIWLHWDSSKIPKNQFRYFRSPSTSIFVSAASAWEIAIKTRIGKLENGQQFLNDFSGLVGKIGTQLPILSLDAIEAESLEWDHLDIFDRILVRQAIRNNYKLATVDQRITKAFPRHILS